MYSTRLKFIYAALGAILLSMAGNAAAHHVDPARYGAELDACTSAIKSRLAAPGVSRIRYVVRQIQPQVAGYELRMTTSVYDEVVESRYSVVCVVIGNNPPMKLQITPLESVGENAGPGAVAAN